MPKDPSIRKVLIIGSGPIVIGQAAEFDYAGTQACLAVREEGVQTILVNSNPATIQTDSDMADVVYIEPLTVDTLAAIIARERPDGLAAGTGFPLVLRAAFTLGGTGSGVAYDMAELRTRVAEGLRLSPVGQVLLE